MFFRLLPILLCSCLIGCTVYYETRELEELAGPASEDPNHINKEGLAITAKRLEGKQLEEYLGKNPVPNIPVFINIENLSDKTFKIAAVDIAGITDKGNTIYTTSLEEVIENNQYSYNRTIPFWIIIIPGVFVLPNIYDSISTANESMRVDYDEKHLKSIQLQPQKKAQGILFFRESQQDRLDHLLCKVKQLGKTEQDSIKDLEIRVYIQ